jgi:cell shape-determining protein MreC
LIESTGGIGDLHMSADAVLRFTLAWLPLLIFVVLLVSFVRKSTARQGDYMSFMRQYCESHLEETRKISSAVERIAAALESKRIDPS